MLVFVASGFSPSAVFENHYFTIQRVAMIIITIIIILIITNTQTTYLN